MPPLSKQKRKSRDQPRTTDGKYDAKRTRYTSIDDHNLPETSMLINNNCVKDSNTRQSGAVTASHKNGGISGDGEYIDLDLEFLNEEWGDDEDSDLDLNDPEDFAELKEAGLVWKKKINLKNKNVENI